MMGLSVLRSPLRVLEPIREVKEVQNHIRFNFATITAYSVDPDETPRFVASYLGLHYLKMLHFCIMH